MFRPTAYMLDAETVCNFPLKRVSRNPAGEKEETPTTLGEVLASLSGEQVGRLECPYVYLQVVEILRDLREDGIDGFKASWFWYEWEWPGDEFPFAFDRFFVMHNDRIVRECISFQDADIYPIFKELYEPYNATREEAEAGTGEYAWVRFWYRKFYQETQAGQITVLNSEKRLHYYPEGRWRPSVALASLQGRLEDRLAKIQFRSLAAGSLGDTCCHSPLEVSR